MALVYKHIRLDTNEVFYIGIGTTIKRAYSKYDRNTHWNNIVKSIDYKIEIVEDDLSWDDACKMERLLIEEYGRADLGNGVLVNMTDGGDGLINPSEYTRKLMSMNNIGEKNPNYGKKHTNEILQKMKENARPAWLGKKLSEQHKQKISDSTKGELNGFFGRTHTENTKEKISLTNKGKIRSIEVRKKMSEGSSKSIYQYDKNNNLINEWPSAKIAGEKLNLNASNITNTLKGRHKTTGGFIWKYKF